MSRSPTVTAPKTLALLSRRADVLKLRLSGLQFDEIAKKIQEKHPVGAWYIKQHAYRDLRIELAEMRHASTEAREEVRAIEVKRLDVMLLKLWAEYEDATVSTTSKTMGETQGPALWIIDRILKIQDRRAKYLGLDEPTKHQFSFNEGTVNLIVDKLLGVIQARVVDPETLALVAKDFSSIDWSRITDPVPLALPSGEETDDEQNSSE